MIADHVECITQGHRADKAFDMVRTSLTTSSSAGIDLLVLRELMDHAHAETTAADVHLAPETVAADWARVKPVLS